MSFGLQSNPPPTLPPTSIPPTSLGGPPSNIIPLPGSGTSSSLACQSRVPGQADMPLNPAMNDAPLDFNKNKGKPPMAVMNIDDDDNDDSDEPSIIAEEITIRSKSDRDSRDREIRDKENQKERDERLRDRDRIRDRDRDRDRDRVRDRERDRDRDRERDRERDRDRERRDRDRERDRNGRDRRDRKTDERLEGSNGLLPKPEMGSKAGPIPGPMVCPNGGPIPVGPGPGLVGPPPPQGPGPASAGGPGGPGPMMANNVWGGMMNPMMGMVGNMMGPMMGMGPMDPTMMGMGPLHPMMGSVMPDGTVMGPDGILPPDPTLLLPPHPPEETGVQKEIVHCKECTLFPPNPNAPLQSTRERPLGCRTIFVGGLPDNATEDMIREIFQRCGEIQTIRMSKKNFCHVRFMFESSVEAAFYFSGYRMRIGSNTDSPNTGRLHVDYAQARDDFHEWECAQRQLQREARHRQRMEQELLHPPSPPPISHYSEHEAVVVAEKIKNDESFGQAVQTLITWLERGNCSKRNANQFYSMIQAANSHVRRLLNEKAQLEEELQAAKDAFKGRMQNLIVQFSDIERVFTSASHKKVWDHFTKAQRKNIDLWKKQSMEIKTIQLEDAVLHNEEMDVSDEEDSSQKKKRREDSPATVSMSDSDTLKEENDSLRCQLEAYKNEVDLVRTDLKVELNLKEQQLKMIQQTMQGLQQKLLEGRRKQIEDEVKIKDLTARLAEATKSSKNDSSIDGASCDGCDLGEENRTQSLDSTDLSDKAESESVRKITDKEAKLIGIISTFLHVHPFGAGVDYVWSYVQKLEPTLKPSEVEALLTRFPTVFKQELCGIGANIERRWQFSGFTSLDNILL